MVYLVNLDLNQNELRNAVLQPLATAPSSPVLGQFYYNTTSKLIYIYNGTTWTEVAPAYNLPTMSSTVKGGAILGNGLTITGDVLALGTPTSITPTSTNVVTSSGHTHAITGFEPTINLTANKAVATGSAGGLVASTTTDTELGYVHGVTSAIQTQLNGKQSTITGAATSIVSSNLTASMALVSDSNGKVAVSGTSATELGYVAGVTGPIQSQIDNIPKYTYLTGLSVSAVLDPSTATQTDIDTVMIAAIQAAYTSPVKWNAVVISLTFLPSDIKKDLMYYYNGTAWVFLYYVTTGVQLANGTTAGLIQEADSNTDISLSGGIGTVNTASKLRTARAISISGEATAAGVSFDGSAAIALSVTALNVSGKQVAIASGDSFIIADSSNSNNLSQSTLTFGSSATQFLANNGTWVTPASAVDTNVTVNELDTTSAQYPVLTQGSTTTGTVNGTAGKDSTVTINPATGTVTATTFSGAVTGNASTATTLQTARTIALSGGATGTATSFDGSANITIPVTSINAANLSGTVGVTHGGTGLTTLTVGDVLVGNGTSAVSLRAIDTTSGGTASSTSLITSGAVNAGLQSVIGQIPLAVTRTVNTFANSQTTATYAITGYVLSVLVVDSVTKEQVLTDVTFDNITALVNNSVTITVASAPTNALLVIITSIAVS